MSVIWSNEKDSTKKSFYFRNLFTTKGIIQFNETFTFFKTKIAHQKAFKIAAEDLIGDRNPLLSHQKYVAYFGVDSIVTAKIWDMKKPSLSPKVKPKYLFWGLMFMKVYNSELVLVTWAGVTHKRYCKYCWMIIEAIERQVKNVVSSKNALFFLVFCTHSSFLYFRPPPQIRRENRLINDNGVICKVSVDKIAFCVQQFHPFDLN